MKALALVLSAALAATGCRQMSRPQSPPQRPAADRGVEPPDFTAMVEARACEVLPEQESGGGVVLVRALDQGKLGKVVPIVVGDREASVLQMKLARQTPPRPLTHDLALSFVAALDGKVMHVVVDDVQDGVFLAKIYVARKDGSLRVIDSRASDALILAVATGTKIHIAQKVIDEAGVEPENKNAGKGPDFI